MVLRWPIWSLYSSIFMVIHWADLVPVFFDTYRNILYRSDISEQDAQSASIPCSVFFLSVGSVSQRKVASPSPSTPQNLPPRLHPSQTNSTFLCVPLYLQQNKKPRCPANTTLPDTRAKRTNVKRIFTIHFATCS